MLHFYDPSAWGGSLVLGFYKEDSLHILSIIKQLLRLVGRLGSRKPG